MSLKILRVLMCLLPVVLSVDVQAQHSDIEFGYAGGKINVGFGPEARVFEASIPTAGIGARQTSNPGMAADEPAEGFILNPNDWIGYNIHGPLFYWNGTAEAAVAGTTTLFIDGLGTDLTVSNATGTSLSSFVVGSERQLIGQAAGPGAQAGEFHSHVDWTLSNTAPLGAYGVLMSLSTDEPGIANSDIFGVMFNFGLTDAQFEAGVDHFVDTRNLAVPEPSSLALLFASSGLVFWRRHRRSS